MIPEISVVVPIYNVAQYIERCAHSLFAQTYKDIEYIFVDDCSPDKIVLNCLKKSCCFTLNVKNMFIYMPTRKIRGWLQHVKREYLMLKENT